MSRPAVDTHPLKACVTDRFQDLQVVVKANCSSPIDAAEIVSRTVLVALTIVERNPTLVVAEPWAFVKLIAVRQTHHYFRGERRHRLLEPLPAEATLDDAAVTESTTARELANLASEIAVLLNAAQMTFPFALIETARHVANDLDSRVVEVLDECHPSYAEELAFLLVHFPLSDDVIEAIGKMGALTTRTYFELQRLAQQTHDATSTRTRRHTMIVLVAALLRRTPGSNNHKITQRGIETGIFARMRTLPSGRRDIGLAHRYRNANPELAERFFNYRSQRTQPTQTVPLSE